MVSTVLTTMATIITMIVIVILAMFHNDRGFYCGGDGDGSGDDVDDMSITVMIFKMIRLTILATGAMPCTLSGALQARIAELPSHLLLSPWPLADELEDGPTGAPPDQVVVVEPPSLKLESR